MPTSGNERERYASKVFVSTVRGSERLVHRARFARCVVEGGGSPSGILPRLALISRPWESPLHSDSHTRHTKP